MADTTPVSAGFVQQPSNIFQQYSQRVPVPQEQKNAMWDFAGNALWEFMDTTTFGALGAADEYIFEESLEEALTGGGPETFAGRVGSGIGGALGFLAPMGLVGKGVNWAAGTARVATKKAKKDIGTLLSTKAGKKGTGYKRWNKLSNQEQKEFVKETSETFITQASHAVTSKSKDLFKKNYHRDVNIAITQNLKKLKLPTTKENVKAIKDIVDDAVGLGVNNSSMPIGELQQRIALALGSKLGMNSFYANIAAHSLDEGIKFALVETPMEVFQSYSEDREMDLTGRMSHAFALGNVLGLIRLVPGGRDWAEGSMNKAFFQRLGRHTASNPYLKYDVTDPQQRMHLARFAEKFYLKMGNNAELLKNFNKQLDDAIVMVDDIKGIATGAGGNAGKFKDNPEAGAEALKKALSGIYEKGKKDWLPKFFKEVKDDLDLGTWARMTMGAMAFNHDSIFRDDIPLEDKVFNVLLGAFMTKKGRVLTYKDATTGKTIDWDLTKAQETSKDYRDINEYLNILEMDPQVYYLQQQLKSQDIATKYLKGTEDTPDLVVLKNILEKHKVIISDDGTPQLKRKGKNAAKEGEHPIYEEVKALYDGIISGDGKVLRNINSLTLKEVKALERDLRNEQFDGLDGQGIRTLKNLDVIISSAIDKNVNKLADIHYGAIRDIFNWLAPGNRQAVEHKGKLIVSEIGISHGEHLTQNSRQILDTYAKMVRILEHHGYLKVQRGAKTKLEVSEADFTRPEGKLSDRITQIEQAINKLVYGEHGSPDPSRDARLMQEGWVGSILDYQMNFRGIRKSYDKMKALESTLGVRDAKGLWEEGDAQKVASFINQHLKINNNLVTEIVFAKNVKPENKQFMYTLLQILKSDMNAEVSLSKAQIPSRKITNAQINELKQTFSSNGMRGFLHSDPGRALEFISQFNSHALTTHIRGSVKRGGEQLTQVDHAIISNLLEWRIVGPNFQQVEIVGAMNAMERLIGAKDVEGLRLKGNSLVGWRSFKDRLIDSISRQDPELLNKFETLSREQGRSVSDIFKELFTNYKTLIEPYRKNIKGEGLFNYVGDIAQIEPAHLYAIMGRLDYIAKSKQKMTHDTLLEQLDMIKGNQEFSSDVRQKLSYMYQLYSRGHHDTGTLITDLTNAKLWNLNKGELELDPGSKTLDIQLKEIMERAELDIRGRNDADAIEANINDYSSGTFSKRTEVEKYQNQTKQTLIEKYNLPKDVDFDGKKADDIISEVKIRTNKNNREEFIEYKDLDLDKQKEVINDVTQVMLNAGSSRIIPRYIGVEKYGVFMDKQNQVYNNSLFRFLDSVVGIDGAYGIVDLKMQDANGNIKDVTIDIEGTSRRTLESLLYRSETAIDPNFRKDADTNLLPYEQIPGGGSIIIRMGDMSWGLAIRKDKLDSVAKMFEKNIKSWEKRSDVDKDSIRKLKEILDRATETIESVDPTTKETIKERVWKAVDKDITQQSHDLQTMVTTSYLSKEMPTYFCDVVRKTRGPGNDIDVMKFLRRIRIITNNSFKELSMNHVDNVINLYKKHFNNKDSRKQVIERLQNYKKIGGTRTVIVADEGGQSSYIAKLEKQIKKEKDSAPDDLKDQMNNDLIKRGEDGLEFNKAKDVSEVDSYMALSKNAMDTLLSLMGANNIEGLGGIKPIIKRSGNMVIVGKTAFIRDVSFDKFFDRHNVDSILFESAVKINHDTKINKDNIFTEHRSIEELKGYNNKDVIKQYTQILKPEDIRVQAIVDRDHNPTISHQSLVDLGGKHTNDVYNWLLKSKIDRLNEASVKAFDASNPLEGISMARFYSTASNMSPLSGYTRWISNNGMPQSPLFKDMFTNQLKSKFIDNDIIKLQTDKGGQSVMSPGTDLRYTTFTRDGKIYSYGQINIPKVAGDKGIDLKRFHLIEHNASSRDRLIKYNEIKEFADSKSDFYIDANSTLSEAKQKIDQYNTAKNTELEIAVVVRRTPHTRPGSNVIVGIQAGKDKGILEGAYGNQAKVNSYDVINRLEGDYDIDKVDFFWDAPTSVIKTWRNVSGEILNVKPEPIKNIKSSEGLDLLDASTVNQWSLSQFEAKKIRGRVVKTQRLLAALDKYSSTDNVFDIKKDGTLGEQISGLVINLEGVSPDINGKIFIDPVKLKKAKELLAEDIQRITDSLTGFDSDIYHKDWFSDFLFGSEKIGGRYEGIFSRAYKGSKKDGFDKVFIPDKATKFEANNIVREMILAALRPYNNMLTLGTSQYSGGRKQSVQYTDIMEGMKSFDTAMGNLNKSVYFNLLKSKELSTKEKEDLRSYFLKDSTLPSDRIHSSGNFRDVFGNFGTEMRPNFLSKVSDKQFRKMLPFERAMAKIVHNDKSTLERPGTFYGEMLNNYHKFYEQYFYSPDFNASAKELIGRIRSNDKNLGYVNYLDYRIKQQQKANRNALSNGHQKLSDYIKQDINRLTEQKQAIEKEFIEVFNGDNFKNKEWARKFRESAYNNIRYEVLNSRGPYLPSDWTSKGAQKPQYTLKDYDAKRQWLNTDFGKEQLRIYAKNKGVIKFKGVHSADQIELLIWDNMLSKYRDIYIKDEIGLDYNRDFERDISDFNKWYSEIWKRHFNGMDHYLDKKRVSTLVQDRMENLFSKWEDAAGAGRLAIWKIMAPKTDTHTYTYFNDRISPAFRTGSLSKIKLGLKFINNAPDKMFTDFEKNMIFNHFTTWHANSFRAHYGTRGDFSTIENMMIRDMGQWRDNILKSSPLLDDIKGWEADIQTTELNPQVGALFGVDNRSVSYTMAHMPLNPSVAKDLMKSSWWSYMPTAYIPANVHISGYPSINGWRSYQNAMQKDAFLMLGHTIHQNILYKRPSSTHSQPYEKIGASSEKGGLDMIAKIQERSGLC